MVMLDKEIVTMGKRTYQMRLGRAYRVGEVMTLVKLGYDAEGIAEFLGLNQSTVQSIISKAGKDFEEVGA